MIILIEGFSQFSQVRTSTTLECDTYQRKVEASRTSYSSIGQYGRNGLRYEITHNWLQMKVI